ncbi:FAD/NAD(P)-binding domain-containing protein [Cadophora sp. DSE1049]|nr:FAD/NAD(P)-binding domain-containing protein [Cadophora sp. DSE1049]
MAGQKSSDRLRVIIVGGSISGLTLAHCLDLNHNVEYVVLEGRDDIHPEVGASITLTWTEKGELLATSDAPALMKKRTGYAMAFLTRRNLLKVLYSNIKDKTKVLTSKRVTDVQVSESGVVVTCKDGSSYDGDIVVGADGIHSAVRGKMQDYIELSRPGAAEKDRNSISTEYTCIFGLGKQPKGSVLTVGDSHRTYGKDHSTLSFVGRDDVLYWFLFSKLDKRYHGNDMPRFSKKDMEEGAKPFRAMPMAPGVNFGQVWENRTFANMACLEESQNQNWVANRMVCIGDSTHKMTPNLGAGGNAAIESAAALANHIAKLPLNPSQASIRKTLDDFYIKRNSRANLVCDVANKLTRIEALDTIGDKIMALYVVPKLGDALWDLTCETIMGAESIESLPLPARSQESTMAWDPETGIGKKESGLTRALWALPLLGITYACQKTMLQGIAFLGDMVPMQTIWLIESIRRGNLTTTSSLLHTLLSASYQVKGLGFIAPIYYFLHYVQSPLSMYAAPDNRLTNMASAKVIIPTIATSFILPSVAMFVAPGIANRQWVNGVFFQPFPLYAALVHRLLVNTVKDTTQVDRIENVTADMKWLRLAYGFATATAAAAYLYVTLKSPVSLTEVFFKGLSNPSEALPLITGAAKVFRYDQIAASTAGAIWVLLSFKDLKKANKIQTGWPGIVGAFAGTTLLAGPGAAMTTLWAWREECLAKKEVDETKKTN